MKEKQNKIDRRNFLKTMGAVGLGSALASAKAIGGPNEPSVIDPNAKEKTQTPKLPQVPSRKLGKTGVEVPCLSFGANHLDNQIILRNAFQWGVNYWDTSHSYVGGNSELNIGQFISKSPQERKKLFIVTKASGAKNIEDVEKRLQTSLERMNTEYIDLYFGVHGLKEPEQLTDELRRWVEDAKKRKLIRFFGFSIHKNMSQCLSATAKLGWIDAIMTSYNFRLMQDAKMQAAIDACYKAGIGLVAMKSLGLRSGHKIKIETEADKKVAGYFLERGFTQAYAAIKAVLADERISSACVGMRSVSEITANVAAALDKTKLSQADMGVLAEYAELTCSGYCAGCEHICNSALPNTPYVSDIMRYLMYYNSYGQHDTARELFAQIPATVRSRLLSSDYSLAEARCPQHLPIGKLVAEAVSKLA